MFCFLSLFDAAYFAPSFQEASPAQTVSISLAILVQIILSLLPFGIFRVLAHPETQLASKESRVYNAYGELFKDLNINRGFLSKHYQILFILRRSLLSVVLIYLDFLPLL